MGNDDCIRVYEIQLFVSDTPIIPKGNVALNASVLETGTPFTSDADAAVNLFDGNTETTKWSSAADKSWVVFAIHNKQNIKKYSLSHAGASKSEPMHMNTIAYELQILDETQCTEDAFLAKNADKQKPVMENEAA